MRYARLTGFSGLSLTLCLSKEAQALLPGQLFAIPEIMTAARSTDSLEGISQLLAARYSPQISWSVLLWENVLAIIIGLPRTIADEKERLHIIERLARILGTTGHDLSSDSFQNESMDWLQGRGHRLLSTLDEQIWSLLSVFFVRLVVLTGAISSKTVFRGLVFSLWHDSLDESAAPLLPSIIGINAVVRQLMLVDPALPTFLKQDTESSQFVENHLLRGELGVLHTSGETVRMFQAISDLAALEARKGMSELARASCRDLRLDLCSSPFCRVLALRRIEEVRKILCAPGVVNGDGAGEGVLIESVALLLQDSPLGKVYLCNNEGIWLNWISL